jgi:hypothetical protein
MKRHRGIHRLPGPSVLIRACLLAVEFAFSLYLVISTVALTCSPAVSALASQSVRLIAFPARACYEDCEGTVDCRKMRAATEAVVSQRWYVKRVSTILKCLANLVSQVCPVIRACVGRRIQDHRRPLSRSQDRHRLLWCTTVICRAYYHVANQRTRELASAL